MVGLSRRYVAILTNFILTSQVQAISSIITNSVTVADA